jgi:hypothetical protein
MKEQCRQRSKQGRRGNVQDERVVGGGKEGKEQEERKLKYSRDWAMETG